MRLGSLGATLTAWAIALIIGFFVAGHYAWNALIGLDPSSFPGGSVLQALGEAVFPRAGVTLAGAILVIAILLFLALATFVAVRAGRRRAVTEADPSRRTFLTGSLAGVAAAAGSILVGGGAVAARSLAGIGNGGRGWSRVLGEIFGGEVVKTHPEWKQAWKGSRVQGYGRLGRTGWKVSDTALGTGRLRGEIGEKITRLAIERGVNYIDTAPDYSGASSEKAVGRAIKSVPRERLFIATKFCTPVGHLGPGSSVEDYKAAVYQSLGRLDTDYVDLIHVHSCDEVERLMDPNMHEAFAQLKTEGKVRFLGFSSHTPNLLDVATRAIESGKFDV
ncbi:MAG: aldo/keto reductase, partial [Candidatus Binatia bacterium]